MAYTFAGEGNTKNDYMADISLPGNPPPEFISRIPSQRAYVDELMQQGVITSYCLSRDRSKLWVTLRAPSEEEVIRVVTKFPLIRWMEVEIQQLMFRDAGVAALPSFSMN